MKKIVLLFVALLLSACDQSGLDPHNAVIPQNVSSWAAKSMSVTRKLSEQDQTLLAEYLARAKKDANPGQTGAPPGMTVGAAIAEQKNFNEEESRRVAEAKARKEKRAKERAARLRKPEDTIVIKVKNIKVVADQDLSYYQKLYCQLAVENIGTRDIAGVTGRIYFFDKSGRELAQLALNLEKKVKADSVVQTVWKKDYNPYSEGDRALAELAISEVKSVFIPEAIVYADGEKLVLLR